MVFLAVDIYYNQSTANTVSVSGSGTGYFTDPELIAAPTGSVAEYDIVNGTKSHRGFTGDLTGLASLNLPLTGGTLSGKLILNRFNTNNTIGFQDNGLDTVSFGYEYTKKGLTFYNFTSAKDLFIADNGDFIYATDRFVVKDSGNVGIGIASPDYKLDVAGTGRFTANITAGANLIITPVSASTDGINYGSYKVLRFNQANTVTILSSPIAGMIYLRPNGDGTQTGQFTVGSTGLATATGNLYTTANLIADTGITIAQTACTGVGLSLYGTAGTDTSTNPIYGLMIATTASKGTHGSVTGTHSVYFTTSNTAGRGWIFTNNAAGTTGNVASISNAGNITASGEITAYVASDRRLKENITPITSALDYINRLNPVTYNWNARAKRA